MACMIFSLLFHSFFFFDINDGSTLHKFAGIGIDDYNGDKVAMLNTVQASFSQAWWVKAKGSSQSSKFCLSFIHSFKLIILKTNF